MAVRSLVRMRTDVPLDVEAVFKPRVPTVVETFMEDESTGNEALPELDAIPEPPEPRKPDWDTEKKPAAPPEEFFARSLETAVVSPDEPQTVSKDRDLRSMEEAIRLAKGEAKAATVDEPKPAAPVAVIEQLEPRRMSGSAT